MSNTRPLLCYVLAGVSDEDRWLSGTGWDLCVICHRVGGTEEISVGVVRRLLGGHATGPAAKPPLLTSVEGARTNVADELLIASGLDAENAFTMAQELGHMDDAWLPTTIEIDGRQVEASECRYQGAWAVMHLDEFRILYVVGRDSVRPEAVVLIEIPREELTDRSGELQ